MEKNISILVKNLVKKFGPPTGGLTAVNDISFQVNKGEIFAFLGPNGAGKTTTIKMLTTLLNPTGGQILINGFDPVKNQDKVRESFGIVFQDPSLDEELTAKENMDFHGILYRVPAAIREERTKDLLEMSGLWDRRDHLVKTFSGGMRRRLEIARGLLHHPHVFFLDEPTIGLDPQTRNQMWNYVMELNKKEGVTIFFTTHYMEEAEKYAQRIAVIDFGKIVAQGTSEELKVKTNTKSLEEAFLNLTGHGIRKEKASGIDHLRSMRQMWRKRN